MVRSLHIVSVAELEGYFIIVSNIKSKRWLTHRLNYAIRYKFNKTTRYETGEQSLWTLNLIAADNILINWRYRILNESDNRKTCSLKHIMPAWHCFFYSDSDAKKNWKSNHWKIICIYCEKYTKSFTLIKTFAHTYTNTFCPLFNVLYVLK